MRAPNLSYSKATRVLVLYILSVLLHNHYNVVLKVFVRIKITIFQYFTIILKFFKDYIINDKVKNKDEYEELQLIVNKLIF